VYTRTFHTGLTTTPQHTHISRHALEATMRQRLPHNRDVIGAKHDDIHCRCSMAGGCSASLGCTTALYSARGWFN
jgi:hypothetical protein